MKAGDRAEQIAAGYLQRKGLALIETHYRCRWGEIDLILRDLDTVVFTEVRLRRSKGFGGAAYSVDARKQARIIATARHYLAGQEGSSLPVRRRAPRSPRATADRMDTRRILRLSPCLATLHARPRCCSSRPGASARKVTVE